MFISHKGKAVANIYLAISVTVHLQCFTSTTFFFKISSLESKAAILTNTHSVYLCTLHADNLNACISFQEQIAVYIYVAIIHSLHILSNVIYQLSRYYGVFKKSKHEFLQGVLLFVICKNVDFTEVCIVIYG